MTLADRLRTIIASEGAPAHPTRPCPMDRDGKHRWQRPWAEWANQYLGNKHCACGAKPPEAAYPEI